MENMNLTYTETPEGYLIPDVTLPEQPKTSLGRYGRMRLDYLKEHQRPLYLSLTSSCRMAAHLSEIEETAKERVRLMTKRNAEAMGVDERMKREDPMKWVGLMNNIKAAAEQEVIRELILA